MTAHPAHDPLRQPVRPIRLKAQTFVQISVRENGLASGLPSSLPSVRGPGCRSRQRPEPSDISQASHPSRPVMERASVFHLGSAIDEVHLRVNSFQHQVAVGRLLILAINEYPTFDLGELPQIEDLERKAFVRDWNTVQREYSLAIAGPLHGSKDLFHVVPGFAGARNTTYDHMDVWMLGIRTGRPFPDAPPAPRHASIQTTMNVYGRAMTDSKRQAHNNVVQMILQASGKEELDKKQREGIANVV
jgi:hypothetical protein